MENNKHLRLTPSIESSFGHGWHMMFGKAFLILLVAVFIMGILNGPATGMKYSFDDSSDFSLPMLLIIPAIIFGLAYNFLLKPVFNFGNKFLYLKAMRNEDANLSTLFEGFRTNYLNIVLANLIVTALIILGFVMLIVPGIIVACRLVLVPYLVMDKKLDAMQAVEKSWQITRGHGWTIFFMAILSIFIFIAGLIFCFVGVIFSFMWIHSAFATLYQAVLNKTDYDNPIPILGVNEV